MQTPLAALGNAVAGLYGRLPSYVRLPMLVGASMVPMTELNISINDNLQSLPRIRVERLLQISAHPTDLQRDQMEALLKMRDLAVNAKRAANELPAAAKNSTECSEPMTFPTEQKEL